MTEQRAFVDIESYVELSQKGPCFICELINGNPKYKHHIIYEDDAVIVFLDKYPTLYGRTLIAPKEHRIHVTADFTIDEYLALQKLVYQVAEAIQQTMPTERIYILTLGSNHGNSHVHWHVAALPPGVPYEQQQYHSLMFENGYLDLSDEEMASLAQQISQTMEKLSKG
ncbi:MAG: HIT family protein [Deltaproteobacteria bacterium]|nr:HIT family protein [Deltaproteobacteria bacterium]